MNAKQFFVLLYLMVEYCYSQVGINTVLPNAQLDIRSSNQATPSSTDGLLIPKIDVFPATNPTAAQQGMLVYLTTATTFLGNPKSIGFYYWDNVSSDWIAVGNNQTSGWSTAGNSGINAATHFIGTTNDADVVFKRNNIHAGLLNDENTSFGLNALNPLTTGFFNAAFGFNALSSNSIGNFNSAFGAYALENTNAPVNSAFGTFSLFLNTSGQLNCAFGVDSLGDNTSGNSNAAFGFQSLAANISGNSNAALGSYSLDGNTVGFQNVAIGENALSGNGSGSNNSGLGFNTSVSQPNLTNATAIGARAQVATSNSMVLGSINGINGATASTNVGIGTNAPQTRLDVMDENAIPAAVTDGNLMVRTNNPQNIDIGGSITLGGMIDDAATASRNFASIEGRKASNVTGTTPGYLTLKTNNSVTLIERMRITSVGDIGIGTATPGGQFELSLNEGRKPGSTTWTVVSDSRLKRIDGNYTKGLNEIIQLKPIRYHYKNNGDRKFEQEVLDTEFSGFIAQEVQPLFPDAVLVDEDGFLNFNMHSILVASINAIKELHAKIVDLEQNQTEVTELKKQIEIQQHINANLQLRLTAIEEKLSK